MGMGVNRDVPRGRTSFQVHTRKLDRLVAHNNMRKAGYTKINKPDSKFWETSKFARHWRDYV